MGGILSDGRSIQEYLRDAASGKVGSVSIADICNQAARHIDWLKTQMYESNSSAPVTGWTRDWPEYRGWSWVVRCAGDDPEAVRSYLEHDNLLSHFVGDDEIRAIIWTDAMFHPFHPMAQPPETPKDIP